ncbi:IS66 family transposase [Chitinophaga sancti]|uniref:Transposase n=1 Tax=Chitinophaga sancti TaxID=1004 RepID=A0A1K1T2T0_9BACT|nr:IS66 family transposase [Chitinophaga sancti]WQD59607.1 IS66 family transposase [Chitinophaga sancti]WQG88260.1 IS66 family transposase [Chitinophaga sancti]SFW90812.1 Transposase [Chitinophaga sancti]
MSESAAHINYKELYEATLLMNQHLLKGMEQQQKSNQSLQDQVAQLQYQLQQLTKLLKGFKSERFVPATISNMQSELGFSLEITAFATNLEDVSKISYTRKKKTNDESELTSISKLPDHLRRETTVLEPVEDVTDCVKIGEEVRETLSWKPGEIFVNRTVVNVYSRIATGKKGKEIIIKSALPVRAINKCLADPALLAQITVDKLVDHKPLNRQLETFKRNGVIIAYSIIADWICLVAKALQPLGIILLKEMYKYDYWHADETTIEVLDRAKEKETHKGYYWSYLTGDGKLIYYDYQPGRGGERPLSILKDFKGNLQVDGYAIYDELPLEDITIFYCMAHARRRIYDAQSNNIKLASHALAEIAKLYAIEQECKDENLSEEQIKEYRLKKSIPILKEPGEWMVNEYKQLRPKTLIAKALAYSIKRWEKLSLYATTGHLQIDNNAIERCMRSVAVGRKNYLFCGSHDAAGRAGRLYSLLVTCKLNNVNPYEWLKDILSQDLSEIPINQIKNLLPHNWKK